MTSTSTSNPLMSPISFQIFQSPLALYVPIFVVATFALLFIPSMMNTGAKPDAVGRAIAYTVSKTIGLILVAVSGVQLTYGLVNLTLPGATVLSSLLLILAVGIGMMVVSGQGLSTVDKASSAVVHAVFSHSCEIIGTLIAVVAALSIGITFLVTGALANWELPVTLLLLGVFLSLASSIHAAGGVRKKSKSRK